MTHPGAAFRVCFLPAYLINSIISKGILGE
jgi:hypothetical protein